MDPTQSTRMSRKYDVASAREVLRVDPGPAGDSALQLVDRAARRMEDQVSCEVGRGARGCGSRARERAVGFAARRQRSCPADSSTLRQKMDIY